MRQKKEVNLSDELKKSDEQTSETKPKRGLLQRIFVRQGVLSVLVLPALAIFTA